MNVDSIKNLHTVADNNKKVYYLYDGDNNKVNIPESIAIILDGNGRYAKKIGMSTAEGHRAGCVALEDILEESVKLDVKYLTVYAFSTENWKRSTLEINSLFNLFFIYLEKIEKKATENNVKISFIGDIYKFPENLYKECERLMNTTKVNTGLNFVIAFNYGSRDEILRAVKKLYTSKIDINNITVDDISKNLDTAMIKDPDLLIRTSGELRISNFLLWQIAYSELYFTDVLWPEFSISEFHKAIYSYHKRERRFGGRNK